MYILAQSEHSVDPILRFVFTTTARRVALIGLFLIGSAANAAAQPVRQILMLQSVDRGNRVIDEFTGDFRVELDQRAEKPVNVVQVVVGPTGFVRASEQAVVDYIRSTFIDRPTPDLIMTVGGPAAVFARKYRQQLFPDTPLLLAAIDRQYLGDAPLGDKEIAVGVDNQFSRTIDTILQLLPQTKQVFMVMGSGQLGQFWHRELENQFSRFHDRVKFVWFDDLSLAEILRICAKLPADSAIFYVTFGTDAAGAAYADDRVLTKIHDAATAPLFAAHNVYLGTGVVGGSLMDINDLSLRTADVAVRLLQGAAPKSITVPSQLPGPPKFDWRELDKWGIPESRLPPASVVLYRKGLWNEHKSTVLGAAGALLIQSLLIVGLLYQRRARQRAEVDSRKNLALAADANRRQTMSALTSAIAHELGQPLSSMISNAQALEMMVTAERATPETMTEILADIRTQGVQATQIIHRHRTMLRNHQLEKKPIDLHDVIAESLALVAHDIRTREIETTVDLPSNPCAIDGDQVLLQQVLVNLVVNAMDAMDATPPPRRRLAIGTDVRTADVTVSVRDSGTGLPAKINGSLFTPFVTTKAHGLGIGLTIARTIVEAHAGKLDAHNNPEGGATFTVTLPRSETTESMSGPPAAVSPNAIVGVQL